MSLSNLENLVSTFLNAKKMLWLKKSHEHQNMGKCTQISPAVIAFKTFVWVFVPSELQ